MGLGNIFGGTGGGRTSLQEAGMQTQLAAREANRKFILFMEQKVAELMQRVGAQGFFDEEQGASAGSSWDAWAEEEEVDGEPTAEEGDLFMETPQPGDGEDWIVSE